MSTGSNPDGDELWSHLLSGATGSNTDGPPNIAWQEKLAVGGRTWPDSVYVKVKSVQSNLICCLGIKMYVAEDWSYLWEY